MELPFDGAISDFFHNQVPRPIHESIKNAQTEDIICDSYPHRKRISKSEYNRQMQKLQVEMVKMQAWLRNSTERVCVIFEGRDAAGKGGTIGRCVNNLNPRGARVVALRTPTESERSQWYFQRYVAQMPSGGEIVFFDRSWYNRAVVERVFGFCDEKERERFFRQVLPLEHVLIDEGIRLFKIWLNVGQGEQLRRFLLRERDPLKQWKLSQIDVEGLRRWDAYSTAISETLHRTHAVTSPWHVVRSDDKRRARLAAMRLVLHALPYREKDIKAIGSIDTSICGGPEIWHG